MSLLLSLAAFFLYLTRVIAANQLIEFTNFFQYKATDILKFIVFFYFRFGLHVQAYNLTSDMKKKLFSTLLCAVTRIAIIAHIEQIINVLVEMKILAIYKKISCPI